jgi:hypothetical protein
MPMDESRIAEYRAREKAEIENTAGWPIDPVHMKTVPWMEGKRRFGFMFSNDLTTIVLKDDHGNPSGERETFASIDELTNTWMGD